MSWLGRWLYYLAHFIWWPLRLKTRRVRVIIRSGDEVLLVRNWFGTGRWNLPGGGMHRGETAQAAMIREVREELAVQLDENAIERKADFEIVEDGLTYIVTSGLAVVSEKPQLLLSRELMAAEWFSISRLPSSCSEVVKKALSI